VRVAPAVISRFSSTETGKKPIDNMGLAAISPAAFLGSLKKTKHHSITSAATSNEQAALEGANVRITADSIDLAAAKLKASGKIVLDALDVRIGTATDSVYYSGISTKSNGFTTATRSNGYYNETILNTTLDTPLLDIMSAATSVEYNSKDIPHYINGLSGDVTLKALTEEHQSWDEKTRALTTGANFLIQAALAVATAGQSLWVSVAINLAANTAVNTAVSGKFDAQGFAKDAVAAVATAGLMEGVGSYCQAH
jgi:hypothetical protein